MPAPQPLRHVVLVGLWCVGSVVSNVAVGTAAPVGCRAGEVARGERISEVCSCRGWTITAECRSQCCSRFNMVAGIHAMCGDLCDRTPSTVASSDLVRETDDGATRLLAERAPRRYPQVRFGAWAFTLPDAGALVSDLVPDRVGVDAFHEGVPVVDVGEPDLDVGGLGVGLTVELAPRWSAEVGLLRSTDATSNADLAFDALPGRLRSSVDLMAVEILVRLGHNDPAVPCPWSIGLGVRRWRVEWSRPTLELDGEVVDGPLFELAGDRLVELAERRQDVDEVLAAVGWTKRWNRLTAGVDWIYGSESSLGARFGLTVAIGP